MSSELPKNIKLKGQTYYFDKRFPQHLQHLTNKTRYSKSLRLKSGTASSLEIQRAALKAREEFELHCKMLQNSDIEAYSERDVQLLIEDILHKAKAKQGEFSNIALDPKLRAIEEATQEQLQPDGADLAELALEQQGFSDAEHRYNLVRTKQAPPETFTVHDHALLLARNALIAKYDQKKPPLLSHFWTTYVKHRNIDLTTSAGRKAQKRWDTFMSLIGEQYATDDINRHVRAALQEYADQKEGLVTSQTIERELSDVMGALKLGSDKYGINWVIRRPIIKPTPSKKRRPLRRQEQEALMNGIMHDKGIPVELAVCCLLAIQGGIIAKEVAQLVLADDVFLDAEIPHIIIRNRLKTEARKRVVPIVLGLDLIREHLKKTHEWLNRTTESNWSARLKKLMRNLLDDEKVTLYYLRHTFIINAKTKDVSVLTINSIAGWSDEQRKVNEHLFHYGAEGLAESEMLNKLHRDSKVINDHLIAMEQEAPLDNVVPLRGKL